MTRPAAYKKTEFLHVAKSAVRSSRRTAVTIEQSSVNAKYPHGLVALAEIKENRRKEGIT